MQTGQGGYTLVELAVALSVAAIALAVALPAFKASADKAQLQATAARLFADLAAAQAKAADIQEYQEIRFAPFADYYMLYAAGGVYEGATSFLAPTRYFEGYLHLPEPTVRFDDLGHVSESGQIALEDPEGDVRDIVVYMGYGSLHGLHHTIGG